MTIDITRTGPRIAAAGAARPVRRTRPPARRPRLRRAPRRRGTSPSTSGRPPWPSRAPPPRSPRSSGPPPSRAAGRPAEHRPQRRPAGCARLDDVVLVRTSAMTERRRRPRPRHRPGRRRRPLGAGRRGRRRARLAVLHGSSPDVGVAGYSLGGGIGWYARKLGLADQQPDRGRDRHGRRHPRPRRRRPPTPSSSGRCAAAAATSASSPRSSSGMFDIETAYAGMLIWDRRRGRAGAARVGRVGRRPPRTRSPRPSGVLNLPPLPEIPDVPAGRQLVVIDGAVLGSDERGAEILAALRALEPEIDTFGRVPAASLVRLHMDPEGASTRRVRTARCSQSCPTAAIDAFLETVGPDASTTLLAGRAAPARRSLGRPHEGGGALLAARRRVPGLRRWRSPRRPRWVPRGTPTPPR